MGAVARSEQAEAAAARAFDACFDAHHVELLSFARRRVADRASAEDVVAETFAVAWRRRTDLPDRALPWLYGIAHRLIANQVRGSRRRGRLDQRLASEPADGGRDPAELVSERESVLSAFSSLSESQCAVLRLSAWEGLNARDAASVLGCSTAAFRLRLHRTRRALAKRLAKAGHERDVSPVVGESGYPAEETR